jgi:peptidoglycan/xylan/chitin deacetylase (PgdA/CDA1 family)
MGKKNLWNRGARYLKAHLTWQEAREVFASGWGIGSHTVEHQCLLKLNPEQIEHELFLSKTSIQEEIGCEVNSLAYPYGDFNSIVKEIAQKHFELAFSVGQGSMGGIDPYQINRFPLSRKWTTGMLQRVLRYYRLRLFTSRLSSVRRAWLRKLG